MQQPKPKIETAEQPEDTSAIIRWGKLITRVTAISATLTGAFAALFSSSSVTSGITLTAAGASTLAAAEKLPDPRYIKTKHIPPKVIKGHKVSLSPDILAKPEKIKPAPSSTSPHVNGSIKTPKTVQRATPSFNRTKL